MQSKLEKLLDDARVVGASRWGRLDTALSVALAAGPEARAAA